MAETINYEPLIPKEPPEGLTQWVLAQGKLNREFLIYKAAKEYAVLEDAWKPAVEVTCTACGRTFLAEKINAGGCHNSYAPAPFGWFHPSFREGVISGNSTMCPFCNQKGETVHIGQIPCGITQNEYTTVISRLSVEGKQDRLLLTEWQTSRWIDKQGESHFSNYIYTAFVVEERKLVRLRGYTNYFQHICLHNLEQRKTMQDDYGKCQLLYPWEPEILEGTTAENCKLDMYIAAGGEYLVSYLAVWRRHPNLENLVMQGWGKLINDLIERHRTSGSYYSRNRGIPRMPSINWKEKRPHKMLHMTKAEFREYAGISATEFSLLSWERKNGIKIEGRGELQTLYQTGEYICNQILELAGAKEFWKMARYLGGADRDFYTLRDYWKMAKALGMDLEHPQVRWPKRLSAAHDDVTRRYKAKNDEIVNACFAVRRKELERFVWSADGITIRPCGTQDEMKQEGKALSHCVARYAEDHSLGKTAIFLIRREDEPEKPWYTLELDEKKLIVKQNRGKCNCARTEEIQNFENQWLEHIRQEAAKAKRKEKKSA